MKRVDWMVLGVLADGRRKFAIDMIAELRRGWFGPGVASLYPALRRLEDAGRITSGWSEPTERAPRRRWYQIARPT